MSDQNLINNWIQQTVKDFSLIPVHHAIKNSSMTGSASSTYKWPLETGDGLIRFFYDNDTLLSVFSTSFRKSFKLFNLPVLDDAYDTMLYFDEVKSCYMENGTVHVTQPDNEDKYQAIHPHTFYLKTGEQFGTMHCLSDASVSGIFVITKDTSIIPPVQFSGTRIYSSKNQYALKTMITDLLFYPYENKTAEFFFKGKIQEFLSYLIFEWEKHQTLSRDSDNNTLLLPVAKKQNSDIDNIRRVMGTIRDNLNMSLSSDEIVQVAHMSLAKLKYTFKYLTGMTMEQYKTNIQVNKACQLLLSTNMKISQIADKCGYQSTAAFGAAFKKQMGISPLQYRKNRVGSGD